MFKFIQKKNEKTSYIVGGDWSELKKIWDKYNQAVDDQNTEKMKQYENKINNLQENLGIKKTNFS
jgi:hypothetical protein